MEIWREEERGGRTRGSSVGGRGGYKDHQHPHNYHFYDYFPVISFASKGGPAGDLDPAAEVSFSGLSQECCVCFIDMVDSTKVAAGIADPEKLRRYYSIFLNSVATIVKRFGAKVIKNAGDSLIYYFPLTGTAAAPLLDRHQQQPRRHRHHEQNRDGDDLAPFKAVIECGLTIVDAHGAINGMTSAEGLPAIDYRISADYGRVELARSAATGSDDLFGPAMNMCAKINSKAEPNGMVVGSNLYSIVMGLKEYSFKKGASYQPQGAGMAAYDTHLVASRDKRTNLNPFRRAQAAGSAATAVASAAAATAGGA